MLLAVDRIGLLQGLDHDLLVNVFGRMLAQHDGPNVRNQLGPIGEQAVNHFFLTQAHRSLASHQASSDKIQCRQSKFCFQGSPSLELATKVYQRFCEKLYSDPSIRGNFCLRGTEEIATLTYGQGVRYVLARAA